MRVLRTLFVGMLVAACGDSGTEPGGGPEGGSSEGAGGTGLGAGEPTAGEGAGGQGGGADGGGGEGGGEGGGVCGDGQLDALEECDFGEAANDDHGTCKDDCTVAAETGW